MTAASGAAGDAVLQIGRYDSPANNTTTNFTQTGGTANVGLLSMGGNGAPAADPATLTLTGGIFSANQFPRLPPAIEHRHPHHRRHRGCHAARLPDRPRHRATATLYFDGGTLRPPPPARPTSAGLTNCGSAPAARTLDVHTARHHSPVVETRQRRCSRRRPVEIRPRHAHSLRRQQLRPARPWSPAAPSSPTPPPNSAPAISSSTTARPATSATTPALWPMPHNIYLNGTGNLTIASGVSETVARLYVDNTPAPPPPPPPPPRCADPPATSPSPSCYKPTPVPPAA